MTRNTIYFLLILFTGLASCRSTKKINTAITPKDTVRAWQINNSADSLKLVQATLDNLHKNFIDFKTFNAKIKVDYRDATGKQQDLTAVVRIIKDSAIWMSLSATFLNVEAFRVLITKNNVILMNKLEKEVQYRTIDYLQEVTKIPFDFYTVQGLLVGNPIFFEEKNASFRKLENYVLVSSIGEQFKNLLTLSADNNLLLHSKLDDVDLARNRTADLTYGDYESINGINFSTSRQVIASEKNRLDIRMNYKQVEFNKELSVTLNVPKNYKRN